MLSKEDYNKEMGENIFIYPLDHVRILGNSIDLTASKFAWTSDGKYIYDSATGTIKVPPRETACVLTREAIYVRANIGGTYHSRVSMARKGFSHLGTMLDPEYFGQSLIVLHNITDKTLEIDVKNHERIVSIIFYYLKTPILVESHKPNPGHIDKIEHFEKFETYKTWNDNNRWATEKRELVNTFLRSEEYKKFIEKKEVDETVWKNRWEKRWNAVKKSGKDKFSLMKRNMFKYLLVGGLCWGAINLCLKLFPQADTQGAVVMATIIVVLISTIAQDLD